MLALVAAEAVVVLAPDVVTIAVHLGGAVLLPWLRALNLKASNFNISGLPTRDSIWYKRN